jgi:hypothetical protein
LLRQIEKSFPGLVKTGYVQTSEATLTYNCVAFVMGDQSQTWWPMVHPDSQQTDSYWPGKAPSQSTVAAFVAMFALFGYLPCESRLPEPGFLKIAIFIEPQDDLVEHVTLQLPTGKWISKMGTNEDILHAVEGLEGPPFYYKCAQIVRCAISAAPAKLRTMLERYGLANE